MSKYVVMLEDDSDDHSLVKDTLLELSISIPVKFFSSSQALFSFLAGAKEQPSLILADHNAVPDNGIAVLRKLKSQPSLAGIPVVILSDSDLAVYREEAYRLGAASFIKKPDTIQATGEKIGLFFRYWLEVAEV
ncbi:MAG TPA: response regulator [Flavisolibacter sp.]|nr:response regulator [Flavisolibacter sp.]